MRHFSFLSVGVWCVISFALFFLYPAGHLVSGVSFGRFILLATFFCLPSLWSLFTGHVLLGWVLAVSASFLCSFFALRFGFLSFLFPIPLFLGLTFSANRSLVAFRNQIRQIEVAFERLDSEANLLAAKEKQETLEYPALKRKLERYVSLSELTRLLSSSLLLSEVVQSAVKEASRVIGKAGGALLLLIEEEGEGLSLVSSYYAKDFPATKSKKGDLFDQWVLKHRRPLLVRDVRKDYRFHPDPVEERGIHSLIVVPLMTSQHITGLLRVESAESDVYTSDDLRLLSIVGDLVASSIENTRLARRTEELARIDELTGLYVHRHFQERLQEELMRAQRNRTPLSLLVADIDHFKTYNDRYGHIAGDLVLKQVARILKEGSSAGDTLCRYGGEEFSIIFPSRTKEEVLRIAETLRQCVEAQPFDLRRETTHVTLSVGVASFPEDGFVKDALFKRVDEALYRAKREGRNRVCGS